MHDTDPSLTTASARFVEAMRALATARHGEPPAAVTELLALLAEQPEWRVFVDGTKNLGHQASSVLLLRRLIELTAFRGRVTVVYADYGRALLGRTADKLALMFAGVDPRRLDDAVAGYGSCDEIRFLPLPRAPELRGAIAFGFTGGADDMAFNGAAALNVRFFLRLQPYLWDDPPSASGDAYYECSRIEQPDGRHFYPLQAWPALRALALPLPASLRRQAGPAMWHWYAQTQRFDGALACRMRNALAVLAAHGDGCRSLWPVYGLQHFGADAAGLLLACTLLALRHAHRTRSMVLLCSFSPAEEMAGGLCLVDALARDLAIGAYGDMPAFAAEMAHCIVGSAKVVAGDEATHTKSLVRAIGRWLRTRGPCTALHVHRACDDGTGWRDIGRSLQRSLEQSEDATVHTIELGPVAMDAFNCFMASADLPCVVEGQASVNLLGVHGLPFVQLMRKEHTSRQGQPNDPTEPAHAAVAGRLADAAAGLREALAQRSDTALLAERLDRAGEFIDDALDEGSTVQRYFVALGEHFARPANDKLTAMLLALREVMVANAE